ncbi:WD40-repeat-containing domain protein [Chiua virens]|nr:WD40-repeat-containing domain protein [Chiua virens]
MLLETGSDAVYAVAFSTDGKYLFSGSGDWVRRFNIADGREVAKQTGLHICYAISVSKDGKRVVCGAWEGASVWDEELLGKVVDVEDGNMMLAVDWSPDSTRVATGTKKTASVWNVATGERLIGPLKFNNTVNGVQFSPSGEQIAVSEFDGLITLFDSQTGEKLVTIDTRTSGLYFGNTPFAWSNNGEQLFAACRDKKVQSFNASTGSLVAESQVVEGHGPQSIAIAANGQFLVVQTRHSIFFLDLSTLARIGPIIEEDEIQVIALSPDSSHVATGRGDGKIAIRNLNTILPDILDTVSVTVILSTQQFTLH